MKKFVPVLLIFTLILTLFSGCKKSEAAKQCEDLIKQIGEVTIDSLEAIEKAEKAYGMLSGEDKGDVKNFDDLTDARKTYNEIKAFSDSVKEFTDLIDRVFRDYTVNARNIADSYEKLTAALAQAPEKSKTQYDALFAPAKDKFDAYVKKCEDIIPSAAVYVKSFKEINKDKDITVEKIGCVAQLDGDTLYYIFALIYKENGETKNVYSTARFTGTPSHESMLKYKDSFYSDKPLSDNLNAIENGNVELDTAKVLEAASK